MKKLYLILILFGGIINTFAQKLSTDITKNRVIVRVPKTATTNQYGEENSVVTTVKYSDGSGRTLQSVGYKISPRNKDVVSATTFDDFGRPEKSYLPYPSTTINGSYQTDIQAGALNAYGDTAPFSKIVYDASGRPTTNFGVGLSWQNSNIKETENIEIISSLDYYYTEDYTHANSIKKGSYGVNSVTKKTKTGEDGKQIIEYYNKEGKLLRQDALGLVTQYAYDPLDRLVCIIVPKMNGTAAFNISDKTDLVFATDYDEQGRAIRTLSPGGGWTEIVYNRLGQAIMSRNARHTDNSQWLVTKYDALGREIIKAVISNTGTRASWQTQFDAVTTDAFETRSSTGIEGYSNSTLPSLTSADCKIVNYYDNYNWGLPTGFDCTVTSRQYLTNTAAKTLTGQLTGSKTRDLSNNNWLSSVIYYDDEGRIIQTHSINRFGSGSINTTINEYLFSGELSKETVVYRKSEQPDLTIVTRYEYDHAGRKLKTFHKVGSNTELEIANYEYDDLGRLSTKRIQPGTYNLTASYQSNISITGSVSNNASIATSEVLFSPNANVYANYDAYISNNSQTSNALQIVNYDYDIRGRLKSVNSGASTLDASQNDLFGMQYGYKTPTLNVAYTDLLQSQSWISKSRPNTRSFTYGYDAKDRLNGATYAGVGSEDYTLQSVNYDDNGNITSLARKGMTSGTATSPSGWGVIDNLTYTYFDNSNKLKKVQDAEANNKPAVVQDFKDKNTTTSDDYEYNADGSIKLDRNRGIVSITYNYLGLAEKIVLEDSAAIKRSIENIYDASGLRMYKLIKIGTSTIRTDYVGDVIYKYDIPYSINHDEGRVLKDGSGNFNIYEYQYRDQQGNLRVAYRQSSAAVSAQSSFEPKDEITETLHPDNVEPFLSNQASYTGNYSAKVSGTTGPSKTILVQAGELITAKVFAHYEFEKQKKRRKLWLPILWFGKESTTKTQKQELTPITGARDDERWVIRGGVAVPIRYGSKTVEKGQQPQAYLKIQVLDTADRVVETRSVPVSVEAKDSWEELTLQYKAPADGKIKVLTGADNVSPVFFDNLTITQEPAIIVQENHYDPWGIELVGIETTNATNGGDENLFQNKERVYAFGLYYDSFGWRDYDPALGIWHTQDPEGQFISPYVGMGNKPNMGIDPDGRLFWVAVGIGAAIGALTNTASQVIKNGGFNNFSWGSLALSTVAGGIGGGASYGIGSAFTSLAKAGHSIGTSWVAQSGAHAISSGAQSAAFGGNFWDGALSGALGSAAGSFSTRSLSFKEGSLGAGLFSGGLAGGAGAALTGGNVFSGIAQGAITAGLNHSLHSTYNKILISRFNELWLTYKENFFADGRKQSSASYAQNQCAIRLSRVLKQLGVDMSSYPTKNLTGEGWARSSKNLADWFQNHLLNKTEIFDKGSQQEIRDSFWKSTYNRTGIVFFEQNKGTSHIDLWNMGKTGSPNSFFYADSIRFWNIK